jgi:hypothetical protein
MAEKRTSRPVVDFFTHNYRISARVYVRNRSLVGQLNDHTSAFLSLEDAYVSNIQHPADIVASHADSILHKENLLAVLVASPEEGLAREHIYGSYFGTYVRKVFFTIPAFQIEGYIRLSSKMDLRTVLTTGTDTFIPLLDGQMSPAVRPEIEFTGGAILVNKTQVEAFWIEEE